ncbi:E3 ubiquitin-protein ligase sina-like [Tribolium madens]|uniref:E3 ubiquitin-protein ligase sina-like n=1 Tax=Tribolium madens TaxID=41895 RepID=UPI001CF7377D|nr:E3 ubiquitin-protein ligase sina-like [Tribolium madens]
MEEHLYDELLVELECPICTNYMSPPIRQCATGHSVCDACRKKLPKCALCQGNFTECRNHSLEALAVKMRYPCINKVSGCTAKLTYTERETHELRCALKGFKCAMEKCTWVGRLEDLAAHWASKKMSSKPYHKSNVCHTKMKSESYYVNMVNAYDRLFWFKCKLTKNKLYWAVQYIGNAAEAEGYYYEIEIFKPGKTKKKILLSDYCQSIELENSQLFGDDSCICINTDAVNGFVSNDQLLIYYLRVNAVKDEKPDQAQGQVAQDVTFKTDKGGRQRDRSKGPPNLAKKDYKKKFNQHQNQKLNKHKDGFVLL